MKLERFVEKLTQVCGSELRSVVLYGSAAVGDHTRRYSDFNVLVVLEQLGLAELKALSSITRQWVRAGNPPPLLFTPDRIRTSLDVFPVEFSDIADNRRVLAGEDPFANVNISLANLRLQLEHELKGKLLLFREEYLLTGGSPRTVAALLVRSSSAFSALYRGVLRLMNAPVPARRLEAVRALGTAIGFDGEIFAAIEELRVKGWRSRKRDLDALTEAYIEQVNTVIDFVDHFTADKA